MCKLENNINCIANYHYDFLINLPNVKGVGLGYKFINGYNTKEPCIHVLVKNKVPLTSLSYNYRIPKSYMGIKTDVINLNGTITQHSLKSKIRPLEAGYSISVANNVANTGTLGCIVFRNNLEEKSYFLLSNNHVFADNNKLPIGTSIVQPSYEDGGKEETDVVAHLYDFVPLKFESLVRSYINYVDVAIAKIANINFISSKIALAGNLKGVDIPKLDETVRKIGRTTGLTEGKIQTINTTLRIQASNSYNLLFMNQIIADIEQDFGDSGSILVNSDNKVVGLFMAGPSEYTGIFNDFTDVLKYTNTQLYL